MNTSPFFLIAALLLFVLGFVAIFFVVATRGTQPAYKRCALQTANEAEFFNRLLHALPEYYVFIQVSMSALLEPSVHKINRRAWWSAFGAISQQRIDYVVADKAMNVIAVIELDDRSHTSKKQQDRLRDERLRRAGIPSLRYESIKKPEPSRIRSEVLALSAGKA
jgi:predicted Abi (CAAX) family protease